MYEGLVKVIAMHTLTHAQTHTHQVTSFRQLEIFVLVFAEVYAQINSSWSIIVEKILLSL